MASRKLLKEKLQALETERDRPVFCATYFLQDVSRDEAQWDFLPENYKRTALENLEGALEEVGCSSVWERCVHALARLANNPKQRAPNAPEQFVADLLGEGQSATTADGL